jgi:hypothetical protein
MQKVLEKGIVRPALVTKSQYISNFSYDLNVRVILNLKQLNTDIEHFHFKMETLQTALTLLVYFLRSYRSLLFLKC